MPVKFLYFGDPHIRGTNPRNRTDSYPESWKAKLREIWALGKEHQVNAFLQPGDTFDLPDVANSVLNDAADVFAEAPAPVYTTAGNHDIPGYNVAAFGTTSLRLLERIVPQLRVINDPSHPVIIGDVAISFTPYSGNIDRDGYGYSPEYELPPMGDFYRLHIAHGMLIDHTPPFDRFTLVQEVKTTAHMVFTGHDHTGYGIYRRSDGVTFCNPGSLTRLAASQTEISRTIQVALITIEGGQGRIELIPLQSAKPGEDVLDRSRIEKDQQRQYAMENFAALIQTASGEKVRLDINQIIEAVAEKEGLAPEVVRLALEKIETARMGEGR
ncbi:metallophosphoesterase [Paenibacillus sp. L3-i20]|uniref:metallophosphoesterase n=1 Tax=Paenibacillus sp. L3-i20 TaxID=2905833 RepID=UPI001EDD2E68|nr:metallophosphoesterase [Paenibacillus sp. L3-i20]GKU79334.1 exonuclease SbcD [Paenibacillus sp. L3-i20]